MAANNGLPVHIFCTENQLDTVSHKAGQIIVCTDSEQMYVDAANEKRIGIGSPVRVATYEALPFAPLDKFYVTIDTGNVYLFVDDEWKQIGSDDVDLSNYTGNVLFRTSSVNNTVAQFGMDTESGIPNVYAGASDGTNSTLLQTTKTAVIATATNGSSTTTLTVTPNGVFYNNHAPNTSNGIAILNSDGKLNNHATISSGDWSPSSGDEAPSIIVTGEDYAGTYVPIPQSLWPAGYTDIPGSTPTAIWQNTTHSGLYIVKQSASVGTSSYGIFDKASYGGGEWWCEDETLSPVQDGDDLSNYTWGSGISASFQAPPAGPSTDFYIQTNSSGVFQDILLKTGSSYVSIKGEAQDLSGYATTSDLSVVSSTVTAVSSALANKADASSVYTTSQVDSKISSAIGEVHTHDNKSVLDNLSAVSGGVAYNGTKLSTLTLSDVRSEVASANHLSVEVVSSLPSDSGYLVNITSPGSYFPFTLFDPTVPFTPWTGTLRDAIALSDTAAAWVQPDIEYDSTMSIRFAIVRENPYMGSTAWYVCVVSIDKSTGDIHWHIDGLDLGPTDPIVTASDSSNTYETPDQVPNNLWQVAHGTVISGSNVISAAASADPNKLYLVPASNGETNNVYDEYLYTTSGWEKIGSTATDISGYVTTAALETALSSKANTSHSHAVSDISNFSSAVSSVVDSKLSSYQPTVYTAGAIGGTGMETDPLVLNLTNYTPGSDLLVGYNNSNYITITNNVARIYQNGGLVFNADIWSGVEVGVNGRNLILKTTSSGALGLQFGNSAVAYANTANGLAVVGSDGKLPASIVPAVDNNATPVVILTAPEISNDAETIHLEISYYASTSSSSSATTLVNTYTGTNRNRVFGTSNGIDWNVCPSGGFGAPQYGGNPIIVNVDALLSTSSITYLSYRWLDSTGSAVSDWMGTAYPNASVGQGGSVDLSGYITTSAVTSSLTSASTNSQIPTAKAVYDAISAIDIPESFDPTGYLTVASASSTYAPISHDHNISNVSGLSAALSSKVDTSTLNDYYNSSAVNSMIEPLSSSAHTHSNVSVLNNFSAVDGGVAYDGSRLATLSDVQSEVASVGGGLTVSTVQALPAGGYTVNFAADSNFPSYYPSIISNAPYTEVTGSDNINSAIDFSAQRCWVREDVHYDENYDIRYVIMQDQPYSGTTDWYFMAVAVYRSTGEVTMWIDGIDIGIYSPIATATDNTNSITTPDQITVWQMNYGSVAPGTSLITEASAGEANTLYLVPTASSSTNNSYDEYLYVNSTFEKLGGGGGAVAAHTHATSDITDFSSSVSAAVSSSLNNYQPSVSANSGISGNGTSGSPLKLKLYNYFSYDDINFGPTTSNTLFMTSNCVRLQEHGALVFDADNIANAINVGDGSRDLFLKVSTPSALKLKYSNNSIGSANAANGLAIVGSDGKLPSSIIPEISSTPVLTGYATISSGNWDGTSSSSGPTTDFYIQTTSSSTQLLFKTSNGYQAVGGGNSSSGGTAMRTPVLMLSKPIGDETDAYHLEVEISTDNGSTYTSIINTRTTSAHRSLVKSTSDGRTWDVCPANGFGPQYDTCPVIVDVNGLVDPTALTFISYRWVNSDGSDTSNWTGMVYPCMTEAPLGATNQLSYAQSQALIDSFESSLVNSGSWG